ncbi:prolyl endopeptidase [Drosophila bipectinata]|uniref:prolyl endopeptidase n=1 Tax=Drosophila bipectinata TaxID=42026 RepID=UPI001C8A8697|nr:LOW QUALITY PROTEIN: prolyl endopeptidase [Drosophila bipectinata]
MHTIFQGPLLFRRFCQIIVPKALPKKYTHPSLPLNRTRVMTSTLSKKLIAYPIARKDPTVEDDFHGTPIKDVYRWLEDPDAAETEEFVNAQNNISRPFLESGEQWKKINEKLTKLWNYPKYGCPYRYGNYYYYFMNTGLQNQSVMYQQKTLDDESQVFLDPNSLSEDGTVALSQKSFSDDGKYMAYGLSESGSDWVKILIRDAETGKDLSEVLEKVKFSEISWTKDNKGFFYGRYPDQDGKTDGSETKQNENQKLYYHRVGESQDKDTLVVEFPEEPSWRIQSTVSDCGKYLILAIVKDCRDNIVFYADLQPGEEINSKLNVKKIVEKFEADYDYITNEGSKVYFRTNKNAPNYQLILIDFEKPEEANWQTIIAENKSDVLDWVKCVDGDKLLVNYIRDVKSVLQVNSLNDGKLLREFDLDIGTIVGTTGEKKYSEIFYNFSSFLNPGTIYRYDFKTPDEKPTVFREIKLNLEGFRQEDYAVEQIFYSSKDGTKVPMFIIRKKRDSIEPRPCLLYGYGGFNISMLPSFGLSGLMFIDTFDGVLAYPNLRGGGEYGEKWHNGGRLLNKQNVFDDFQAAAEYLIDNKYTTKDRLAIQGGSNGGLLVGACINQRPDLFGAAVAQVGVMDMLRFHKFTIGHAWCSDYGNPSEKEHFENLYKFSPLHNVHTPKSDETEYPSTLILTADHDDRVSPLHSLKFIAALQEAVRESEFQKNPLLLRVYQKAGHGAGKPTSKRIEEATDILTFLAKSLNIGTTNV